MSSPLADFSPGLRLAFALVLAWSSACAATGSAVVATSSATPASGTRTIEASAGALDAKVPELLARYGVASVGLALIEDGRVVLERAYGEQAAGVTATPAPLY